jgi:hypothetical protein
MVIPFKLPPETEEQLRERAAAKGQTVDSFVRQIVEQEILGTKFGASASTCPPADPDVVPSLEMCALVLAMRDPTRASLV